MQPELQKLTCRPSVAPGGTSVAAAIPGRWSR